MGRTKLRRLVDDMIVKAVRAVAPIVNTIPEQCKACGSKRIVRFGHYQGVQRWRCRDCRRTFVQSDAPFGMKTSSMTFRMR